MRDANHDVPEEMSSDTNFGVLAGPICERCDDDWIDHGDGRPATTEESGDVREVSTDIVSVLDHGANEGMPSDALSNVCTGAASHEILGATRIATLSIDGPCDENTVADELIAGALPTSKVRARMGALEPVRIRAVERSAKSLASHARFLQYVFRRAQRRATLAGRARGAWTHGGMSRYFPMLRPVHAYRCHTSGVANDSDFVQQAARARDVMSWYACYVRVLGRLDEKTPAVLSGYCGAGGTDEGVRRAGAVSHGIDLSMQLDFRARFGEEHFTQGDARDERVWLEAENLRCAGRFCAQLLHLASLSQRGDWVSRRSRLSLPRRVAYLSDAACCGGWKMYSAQYTR